MKKFNVYNSLTNRIEPLNPLKENEISMYVCGPTVYGDAHIGNCRPVIVFDVLYRLLTYIGYKVTYMSNITDVDDKIINKAIEEGVSESVIANRYLDRYLELRKDLNAINPTYMPRVTDNIENIINFISKLIELGYAYESNGDVFFRVNKVPGYGRLSNLNMEDLRSGARIEENSAKENPMDFALWKKTEAGIKWDTPWCKGRPGWHTECVVMINALYPDGLIDIHGGGFDLKFPHHENEIAQSEALTGKKFSNFWMHSAYINVNGEKMSKSLNNFFTARDVLKEYSADAIRFFILSAHYRMQINFSKEVLDSAKASVERLYNTINNLENLINEVSRENMDENEQNYLDSLDKYRQKYIEKMDDDFNTADAITVLFELSKDINTNVTIESSKELATKALELFRELGQPLGLLQKSTQVSLEDEIEELIKQRQEARKNKDFALADKIRDDLKARGIVLLDTPQGVRWRIDK